jgi:hypothetical protein
MRNLEFCMWNLERSGSYGWQKKVQYERVRGSFLKQSVVSAAEMNTCALSMMNTCALNIIKQNNIKFFPFLMLRGGMTEIQMQSHVSPQ